MACRRGPAAGPRRRSVLRAPGRKRPRWAPSAPSTSHGLVSGRLPDSLCRRCRRTPSPQPCWSCTRRVSMLRARPALGHRLPHHGQRAPAPEDTTTRQGLPSTRNDPPGPERRQRPLPGDRRPERRRLGGRAHLPLPPARPTRRPRPLSRTRAARKHSGTEQVLSARARTWPSRLLRAAAHGDVHLPQPVSVTSSCVGSDV